MAKVQPNHFHFIVYCYNDLDKNGNPLANVIVDILSESAQQAVTKAASLIPLKGNYVVMQVVEHIGNFCK